MVETGGKTVGKTREKMRISMGIFHGRWKLPWNIDGEKSANTHLMFLRLWPDCKPTWITAEPIH